jgi:hypothetical protein
MAILLRYIHYNGFIAHLPAMHVDLLCACWYPWAVKGSSSLSFCRLPISLRFTSCPLLCPKLTDAPYSGPGTRPPPFLFQNGVFIHRICTLSLPRVQDKSPPCYLIIENETYILRIRKVTSNLFCTLYRRATPDMLVRVYYAWQNYVFPLLLIKVWIADEYASHTVCFTRTVAREYIKST